MFATILHSISVFSFCSGVPWRSLDIRRGWHITQVARVMISLSRLWATVWWETHLAVDILCQRKEHGDGVCELEWRGFEYRGFGTFVHSTFFPLEGLQRLFVGLAEPCGQRDAVLLLDPGMTRSHRHFNTTQQYIEKQNKNIWA